MNKTLIESTEYIRGLLINIDKKSGNDIVLSILNYLKNLNLPEKHDSKKSLFCQRTAEQILKDGFTTGCTDDAIVFLAFAKAAGLKPVYVEALGKEWLESPMENSRTKGHAFVIVNGKLVEPQRKIIFEDPKYIDKKYVIYAEGNEPYDFGLMDFETSMKKFVEFKENYQKHSVII